MRSGDYNLELVGGPLAGRMARVHDTEVRLSVVREGGALRVERTGEAASHASTARVIGSYRFSHREESLVWFPAIE
jgi:hypothetical protein